MRLQQGMNFRPVRNSAICLMSRRKSAPYVDRIEDDDEVLVYEGHDVPQHSRGFDPKTVDQEGQTRSGRLTQNGIFYKAAVAHRDNGDPPRLVKVYEKLDTSIWVYNGLFELVDARTDKSEGRRVFKFRLHLIDMALDDEAYGLIEQEHNRLIPSEVKRVVLARDRRRCVLCGSMKDIQYDHDLPFSSGGSSLTAENVRILCRKCNLAKGAKIE